MIIFESTEKDRIVFHFNKASLQDKTIPMWTIKHKGHSHYVSHVESSIGMSTKETPDNEHTQGSIMFRGKLKIEDNDGIREAIIS